MRPSVPRQKTVGWPLSDHADRRENCVTALSLEEARERSRLLDVRASGSVRRLLADQVEDLRRSAAVRSAY